MRVWVTANVSFDSASWVTCPGGAPPFFCHYESETRADSMAPFDRVLTGEELRRSPVQWEPGGRAEWDGFGAFAPPQQASTRVETHPCPLPGDDGIRTWHLQQTAWADFRLDLGTPAWQDGKGWTLSGSDPGSSSFEELESGSERVTERFTWNLTLQPRTVA